jgi:YidC/Oxa1 family membrane protein insertase
MQVIQPELAKLQEKYKSKDAITRQRLQQERLLLMEKYNINPMAGCLPLFIQMPILLGFYQAIMRTEELKGNSFLWFELASPDPYFLLPILAGVSTFIQQKVMTKGQEGNPQIVMMLWLMPVMIIIFSLYLPSALPLYWIVGNIFSIIQSYFIQTPEITNITTQPAVAGRTGGRKK